MCLLRFLQSVGTALTLDAHISWVNFGVCTKRLGGTG